MSISVTVTQLIHHHTITLHNSAAPQPSMTPEPTLDHTPPSPLPTAQEALVHDHLQMLSLWGYHAKLKDLITKMMSSNVLSTEMRADIQRWFLEFTAIPPVQKKERAFAIAILILQVIRPISGQPLSKWEHVCWDVLQQLLPPEASVAHFLALCDVGLREKKLLRAKCRLVDKTTQVQLEVLNRTLQSFNTQIEEARQSVQQHTTELQEGRIVTHNARDAKIQALETNIELVGLELEAYLKRAAVLKTEDPAQLQASIDEIHVLLEQVRLKV